MICKGPRVILTQAATVAAKAGGLFLALLLLSVLPAAAAPLPEAALVQAREAEKLAAGGQAQQAIGAYEKIDVQFPGHAAVCLRLAQLYDASNNPGAALFYYRRYVTQAGPAARDEAQARLGALEITPGAAAAAQALAAKKKVNTAPLPEATPTVKHSVAALTKDGVVRPITGPQDLEKLARGETLPAETATPVPTMIMAPAITPLIGAARPKETSGRAVRTAAPPSARAPGTSGVQDEDAALASAFARRTAGDSAPLVAAPTPRTVIVLPDRRSMPAAAPTPGVMLPPDSGATPAVTEGRGATQGALQVSIPASPARGSAMIMDVGPAAQAPSLGALEQAIQPAYASATPSPASSYPAPAPNSPKPGFFSVKQIGGALARLKLSNTIPGSTLTFVAIPDGGGQAVNAVIASGESRVFEVAPGSYELIASALTTDYPPSPLLDRRLEQDFEAGWQYTRRITPEFVQGLE